MALYDRSYMKAAYAEKNNNILIKIIVLTVVCFVIQKMSGILMGTPNYSIIDKYFSFSSHSLFSGRIWTFFTYALLHGGPFHLFINMIISYLFGRTIEAELGSKKFLQLYLLTIFSGAALSLLLNLGLRGIAPPVIGASAAVAGMITLFCLRRPNEQITFLIFFILPVTLQAKKLLWITIGIEVLGLMGELSGTSRIASSAHLGGMLGAWIFYQLLFNKSSIFEPKKSKSAGSELWKKAKAAKPNFTINLTNRNELKKEVDRILDKINASGFGSLTDEERKTLDKAKDLLHK